MLFFVPLPERTAILRERVARPRSRAAGVSRLLSLAVIALSMLAGCRSLALKDGSLGCSQDHQCPSPYLCNRPDNRCYLHLPDGGVTDDTGATDGSHVSDGGRMTGGKDGGKDSARADGSQPKGDSGAPPASIATGSACQLDADCMTGACRDGVCCENACTGACRACAAAYTGLDNGKCGPVNNGIDPHDDCADQTATDRCGQDGQCNGAGQCRKVQSGQSCSDATCAGATFTAAGQCDGNGTCQPGMSMNCGGYPCATTGCAAPCTLDSQCPNGSYCSNGTCKTRKLVGTGCAANGECALGFCSPDGVCCTAACAGACQACTKALTGQPDGTCASTQLGLDPRNDCSTDAASTCGHDGTCDGKGGCHFYDSSTSCNASSCSGSTFTPGSSCDGAGHCVATGAAMSCGSAACATTGCKGTCAADSDCAMGSYCIVASGTCAAKKVNGTSCGAANECTYNACVDGVCCESACPGLCYACSKAKNGATSGSCLPIAAGTDPDNECASSNASTCGQDGTCDGNGACRLWMTGTQCLASACNASGNFVASSTCSQGACRTPAASVCGSAACDATNGCKTTCASNQDCVGATYCNTTTKTCTAQKALGTACGAAGECSSNDCVDGVCCNTTCTGTCVSCLAKDNGLTDGTCGNVKDGTDPASECAAGTTTCGLDGTCGGGKCRFAPTTVSCGAASCVNASGNTTTTFTAAVACNGNGTCPTVTGSACPGKVLCASATACKSSTCAADTDCVSGNYCASGTCTQKKAAGGSCSGGNQCAGGICSPDGACCNSACTLSCQACKMASTGIADGTCAPKLTTAGATNVANCGGVCSVGYGLCTNVNSPASPVCNPLSWGFETGAPSAWQDSLAPVNFTQVVGTMGAGPHAGTWALSSFGNQASVDWESQLHAVLCGTNSSVGIDVHGKTFKLYYYAPTPKPTASSDVSTPTCTFTYTGYDTDNFGFDGNPFTMTVTQFNTWTLFSYTFPSAVVWVRTLEVDCTFGDWTGPVGSGEPGTLYFDDISIN